MLDNDMNKMSDESSCALYFIYLFLGILTFCVCIPMIKSCCEKEVSTIPIEEIHKIDSIDKTIQNKKESIIKLDSEKNDTIEKVKTLSNDSTLELFRELVRE